MSNFTSDEENEYWLKVVGHSNFKQVIALQNVIHILPHSSAACEWIFNIIALNKVKQRNALNTKFHTGILQGKRLLKVENKTCYEFICSKNMLQLYFQNMYDFKN